MKNLAPWAFALVLLAALVAAYGVGRRLLALETAHREGGVAGLERALRWDDSNPELHLRLARVYRDSRTPDHLDAALEHTRRAARLSPYDWRAHWRLAELYELEGQDEAAGAAWLQAIERSPRDPLYQWRLANFHLRAGRSDDFWEPARKALAADSSLMPSAFHLMVKMNAPPERIDPAWPQGRAASLQLIGLLSRLDRRLLEPRYMLLLTDRWRGLLIGRPPPSFEEAATFFEALLKTRSFDRAHREWIALARANSLDEPQFSSGTNRLWNGSFELPLAGTGLGWRLRRSRGVTVQRVTTDAGTVLEIAFDGSENSNYTGLEQRSVVKPGATYRFSYDVRTEGLTTDRGPYFEFWDPVRGRTVHSTAELFGSAGWQPRSSTFRVGADTSMLVIRLRRRPSREERNRIAGTLWLDRLVLSSTEADR